MNDENPTNEQGAATPSDSGGKKAASRRLPEPLERGWFALQERVIWPLQDRFALQDRLALRGPRPSRTLLVGGAVAVVLAGIVVAVALSSGGGLSVPTTVAVEATAPLQPDPTPAPPKPKPKQEVPRETLHGAAPVFSPPSPASKGGEKTGESKAVDTGAASDEASNSEASNSEEEASGSDSSDSTTSTSPSPASATISSDPKSSDAAKATAGAAARAAAPAGPAAGPAALRVAREFAQGFVVYETGGEESAFRDAFATSATPELRRALLKRPPKQPAGVAVPRAKVLNVVAGPSQGKVYEVSVSLLRVGVTSELRLEMEKLEHGRRAEWRVTDVLG